MERLTKEELMMNGWSEEEATKKFNFQEQVLSGNYEIIDIRPEGDQDLEDFLLHHPLDEIEIISFDLVNNVATITGYPFSIPIDSIRLLGIFKAIILNTKNDKFVQKITEDVVIETFIQGEALIFFDEEYLHDSVLQLNELDGSDYVIIYL